MSGGDVPPPRARSQVLAELRHELPLSQSAGRPDAERPGATFLRVDLPKSRHESLAHGARSDHNDVLVAGHAVGDGLDEPVQVFQPTWLPRGLRGSATTVAGQRVVTDVAGRPTMCRHVRREALHGRAAIRPADDDGLSGVDPDEDAPLPGVNPVRRVCRGRRRGRHERAQAGRVSLSAARSA